MNTNDNDKDDRIMQKNSRGTKIDSILWTIV